MRIFIKKYAAVLASPALFFLGLLCYGFLPASVKAWTVLALVVIASLSIRVADDIFDYKMDCLKDRDVFSPPVLMLMYALAAFGAAVICVSLNSYYALLFFVWNILCCFVSAKSDMAGRCVKITLLPLLVFLTLLELSGALSRALPAGGYLLTGAAMMLSAAFGVISLCKKRQPEPPARETVGGKAYNLLRFPELNCPRFFVLDTVFFDKALKDGNPSAFIEGYIKGRVRAGGLYAVRSSAADEDGAAHSFAGMLDTFLNVKPCDLAQKILDCHSSAFGGRAGAYREINGLSTSQIKAAVIVQEMIEADFAGVMFTVNPATSNPDELLISAVAGLGEKLVSGESDSSDYVVNGSRITKPKEDILPPRILKRLILMAEYIREKSNRFQDIEFCTKGKNVYFLQTRDVAVYGGIDTRTRLKTLDNSNIVESYCGCVTPLTASFAKEMYYNVYRECMVQSGVSQRLIDGLEPVFKNMLDTLDGKIYYNLNSWYLLTCIFPRSKSQIKNMERMMGLQTEMGAKRLKMSVRDIVRFVAAFISRTGKIEKESGKFLEVFYETTYPYSFCRFSEYDAAALTAFYRELTASTLYYYTVPILNDIAAMTSYGKLMRLAEKRFGADAAGLAAAMLSHQGDVESAQSAAMLGGICDAVKSDSRIYSDLFALDAAEFIEKYEGEAVGAAMSAYLKRFGARVPNELKLETITMLESPDLLVSLIKEAVQAQKADKADAFLQTAPKPAAGRKLEKAAKRARFYIKNRERLRITRTYLYAAARNVFLRFGEIFSQQRIIEDKRDIFFLTKDEIFSVAQGGAAEGIRELIGQRKQEYEVYKSLPVCNRIVFYRDAALRVTSQAAASDGALRGVPSGAGVVEGYVRYCEKPDAKDVGGKIILARQTDPGWITVFPVCKGLIVEKGSVLSHSAVVARELGVPAVVGVADACARIKDGDYVRLDSVRGEVTVLYEKPL